MADVTAEPSTGTTGAAAPEPGASTPTPTDGSSVSSPANGTPSPTSEGSSSGQAGRDWSKDYESLKAEHDKTLTSYNELRGKLVTQGTERNQFSSQLQALNTQVKQLGEALAKATQQPYDPDRFMEELRTQGPELFDKRLQEALGKKDQEYKTQLETVNKSMRKMESSFQVKERRADAKNYPDFSNLEEAMSKIMEQLRTDHQAGLIGDPDAVEPGELVDFLYNQAKLQHSQDAIKAAQAHGANQERARLANEADTAVAGGGKSSGTTVADPKTMTSEQLRGHFAKMGMVEQ